MTSTTPEHRDAAPPAAGPDHETGPNHQAVPGGEAVPNHHAHHPGFSGVTGLVGALSMAVGRDRAARATARLAGVRAGDRLVDVGCGPGRAARLAASRGATAIGVDPAPVMLRTARLLDRRSAVEWREGSAEALPVDDGWATVLWSLASVHHWRDVELGVKEAWRVLGSGGRLVIAERRTRPAATGLASHGWTEAQAEAFAGTCRDLGFVGGETSAEPAGRTTLLVVRAVRP